MSGPGKGRYTQYVPEASERNNLLKKIFNKKAGDAAVFYGSVDETDNTKAAAAAVKVAVPLLAAGVGNPAIFPAGVNMHFQGTDTQAVPDLETVTWASANSPSGNSAGGPANAFVPDVTSPGPGKKSGLDKSDDPGISVQDIKPNYIPGGPDTGTVSPSATSANIGNIPIGVDLVMGKSSS